MNLLYHRDVQRDVSAVLDYYDAAGRAALGDAFYGESHVRHEVRYAPRG